MLAADLAGAEGTVRLVSCIHNIYIYIHTYIHIYIYIYILMVSRVCRVCRVGGTGRRTCPTSGIAS